MRIYEELFIVKPDAPDEEVDQFIEQMKSIVTNAGGSVDKFPLPGRNFFLPPGFIMETSWLAVCPGCRCDCAARSLLFPCSA